MHCCWYYALKSKLIRTLILATWTISRDACLPACYAYVVYVLILKQAENESLDRCFP